VTQNQLDLVWDATERDIKRAVDHADREVADWSDRAAQSLKAYIAAHRGERFTSPQVRAWAYEQGLPQPPTNMAWGGIFLRASKQSLIRRAGYTQYGDATMHRQSVAVWET
jgi:hypothetical protein